MNRYLYLLILNCCLCTSLMMGAQELSLCFNPNEIKFQNPTEKRLNDAGDFEDPLSLYKKKHSTLTNGKDLSYITLTLSELDSLMNLRTKPDYLVFAHKTCNPSDFEGLISAQKERLGNMINELASRESEIDLLKANVGKKLGSKEQENLLVSIIDEMGAKRVFAPSDALKALKKGKIHKSLTDILTRYSILNTLRKEFAIKNIAALDRQDCRLDVLFSLTSYPTYNDLPENIRAHNENNGRQPKYYWTKVNHKEFNFPIKTVYDSIPNPLTSENLLLYPDNLIRINNIKVSKAQEKFAWVNSKDYSIESENYPLPITYRKYKSHPEYKVSDTEYSKGVFTADGSLVAYVIPGQMHIDPIKNSIEAIYAHSYKENAYGIKNASSNTRDYILEKAEVKFREGSRAQRMARTRIKRIDKASLAKPDNDYMVAAILASKQAERITQQDIIDHTKYYSRDGENWLSQISSDWEKRLGEGSHTWTDILSPTSYSVTYFDINGKPALRETYKAQNTTPFRIEVIKTVEIF